MPGQPAVAEKKNTALARGSILAPSYQAPLLTDFASVNPDTPLESLNLNWRERDLPERERTKHVHRLHPYLGKFIPQLVEVFLRKFQPRIVCDPFVGSGTTLVEANALGVASIGCDISPFNCLLSKVKTDRYDISLLRKEICDIISKTHIGVSRGLPLDERSQRRLEGNSEYLREWFAPRALEQLLTFGALIPNYTYQDLLRIVWSRAARSARLTKHFELDFPSHPQREAYYCHKHHRICRPTEDAFQFLRRYAFDTLRRVTEFSRLRIQARVKIMCGDSREMIFPKFDMILTSPPYVGLIDYHEQHRYAYELFSLLSEPFRGVKWYYPDPRMNEPLEIGPASAGASPSAKAEYAKGIREVFINLKRSLRRDGVAVIVVGDRYDLYPEIADSAGFRLTQRLERHVNRRTGRRNSHFYESILIWRLAE